MSSVHRAVLLSEVLQALEPSVAGTEETLVFDGTVGGGGHSEALLESSPKVCLLGTDRDSEALARAARRLERFGDRFHLAHTDFTRFREAWAHAPERFRQRSGQADNEEPKFQRMLLDLGISSDQLDTPGRGFSFQSDGPLDMRMDSTRGMTAAEFLNTASERDIKIAFLRGGVDRGLAVRLAREIPRRRPLNTTRDFAELCSRLNRPRRGEKFKNPATLPFQALRIEVNKEFDLIERFMEIVPGSIAPGGRLAVISFHSLEDKFVTRAMRTWSRPGLIGEAPFGRLLTKQAVVPGEAEIAENPRARSARLRVFEREN